MREIIALVFYTVTFLCCVWCSKVHNVAVKDHATPDFLDTCHVEGEELSSSACDTGLLGSDENDAEALDIEIEQRNSTLRLLFKTISSELLSTRKLIEVSQQRLLILERLRLRLLQVEDINDADTKEILFELQQSNSLARFDRDVAVNAGVKSNHVFFETFFSSHFSQRDPLDRKSGLLLFKFPSGAAERLAVNYQYPNTIVILWIQNDDGCLQLRDVNLDIDLHRACLQEENGNDKKEIRSLALGGIKDPYIISVYRDGTVGKHRVSVIFYGMRIAGRKDGLLNMTLASPAESGKTPIFVDFEQIRSTCLYGKADNEAGSPLPFCSENPAFAAIVKYRREMLLISQSNGTMSVHNSEFNRLSWAPLSDPVSAVASNDFYIAYSIRKDIVLTLPSIFNGEASTKMCYSRFNSGFASLAFDKTLPAILFAGTNSGEVLVFNTRTKPSLFNRGGECRISWKLEPGLVYNRYFDRSSEDSNPPRSNQVFLYALPKILLVIFRDYVFIYNTTFLDTVQPRLVFAKKVFKSSDVGNQNAKDSRDSDLVAELFETSWNPAQFWLRMGLNNTIATWEIFHYIDSPVETENGWGLTKYPAFAIALLGFLLFRFVRSAGRFMSGSKDQEAERILRERFYGYQKNTDRSEYKRDIQALLPSLGNKRKIVIKNAESKVDTLNPRI